MKGHRKVRRAGGGFTLIELMIVIAIIAVIAAISIPGIMSSIRASNERSACTSLGQIRSAEVQFRGYGGLGTFYYTADLAGMHWGKQPNSTINADLVIDDIMARSDAMPVAGGTTFDWDQDGTIDWKIAGSPPATPLPKSSYIFSVLTLDETGAAYKASGSPLGASTSRFGYQCRPNSYPSSGRYTYHVSESGQVYQKDVQSAVTTKLHEAGGWNVVQ